MRGKPRFQIPTMRRIRAIPWNQLTVASTFSGCGGSCTGYRMAGFRVLWANEFVPAAQESYEANKAEGSVLDTRDIKEVTAPQILKATGLAKGELDVLDGSPPCQAFSTAGRLAEGWGDEREYQHGATQRNEDLFDEYLRLLRGLKPRAFVAENVSGLVTGVAKGFFLEILASMKASGYQVRAKLVDAQWLGVPQRRKRVIFVGIREDLELEPPHPQPLPYRYSIREALPAIVKTRHDTKGQFESIMRPDLPCPTITGASTGSNANHYYVQEQGGPERKFSIRELRKICGFPSDFKLEGPQTQQWMRLANSVPPVMMAAIAAPLRDALLELGDRGGGNGQT